MSKRKKGVRKFKPLKVMDVRDRVLRMEKVPAGSLRSHPLNWRQHGDKQRAAMRDLFDKKKGGLGFVKPLDVYVAQAGDTFVTEGRLTAGDVVIMDGHCRVEELPPDFMVSINVTDLTEDEAKVYLATCDPLSALAGQDDAQLTELLSQIDSESAAVQEMLADLLDMDVDGDDEDDGDESGEGTFQILITCKTEEEQRGLLDELLARDVDCKALVA